MTQRFVRRQIAVTLSTGGPGGQQAVQQKIDNGRIECEIIANAGNGKGQSQIRIYGLHLSTINKFTTIGLVHGSVRYHNQVIIEAGNEGENLSYVYKGSIASAVGNFRDAPNVGLDVSAVTALYESLKPAKATSYKGSTDVAQAMEDLAKRAGYGFKNQGVTAKVSSPHLTGSLIKQMQQLRKMPPINMMIDKEVVYIWPKGSFLNRTPTVVTPGTDLVSYPRFSSQSVDITTRFLPSILVGDPVEIKHSELPLANNTWQVAQVHHRIASQTPNGPWFTDIKLFHTKTT